MPRLSDAIYAKKQFAIRVGHDPKYVYLGYKEYRDLVNERPFGWHPGMDKFQGLELIVVERESHFHVA